MAIKLPKIKRKGIVPRTWRKLKRLFLILFLAQLIYIILLKWVPPPLTLTMAGNWFSLIGTGAGFHKAWAAYDEISPSAKLAAMAGEDQLFPDHNGFDFKSIEKAWKHNRKSKKIRGASTISQQTARNVFLWQGRSWFRKGLEVYFTFMIEHIWGKKRILEIYLNVAQMGNGIFGIEAAAENYYHKPAKNLSRYEAAMIIATLPNPLRYKVKPPTRYTLIRQGWILRQMNNLQTDPDVMELVKN